MRLVPEGSSLLAGTEDPRKSPAKGSVCVLIPGPSTSKIWNFGLRYVFIRIGSVKLLTSVQEPDRYRYRTDSYPVLHCRNTYSHSCISVCELLPLLSRDILP